MSTGQRSRLMPKMSESEVAPAAGSAPRPDLVYLTTEYPHVSHTFIRREIAGLERLGYRIHRVALRRGGAIVDPEDLAEQDKTLHLLEQPRSWQLAAVAAGALAARMRLLRGVAAAWRLHRASERGLIRHAAYLIEALMLLRVAGRLAVRHVHVHFGTNSAAIAYLAQLMGGPSFSMTIHGPDEFDAPIGFSLGRKVQAAAFAVAISSFGRSQIQRWVPFQAWHKLHVVRCTVGDEWFDAARDIQPGTEDIVCVGRLSEQKGQLPLIEAYAEAVGRGMRGRLLLVGDGGLRPQLEARVAELGIADRVVFLGWRTGAEVRQHLLAARALVLPSFAEGLPVVIMEAMALRRPVLSSMVMGIPELVRDGRNGWLVIAGDRENLTEALLQLDRTSLQCLHALGDRAQENVRARHSTDTEVARLDELLRRYAAG